MSRAPLIWLLLALSAAAAVRAQSIFVFSRITIKPGQEAVAECGAEMTDIETITRYPAVVTRCGYFLQNVLQGVFDCPAGTNSRCGQSFRTIPGETYSTRSDHWVGFFSTLPPCSEAFPYYDPFHYGISRERNEPIPLFTDSGHVNANPPPGVCWNVQSAPIASTRGFEKTTFFLSPAEAEVAPGQQIQITAIGQVPNCRLVQGPGSVNSSCVYSAPASIPSTQIAVVEGCNIFDANDCATSRITVRRASLTISTERQEVLPATTLKLKPAITPDTFPQTVKWKPLPEEHGSISSISNDHIYTAPPDTALHGSLDVVVEACSTVDPTICGTATLRVPDVLITITGPGVLPGIPGTTQTLGANVTGPITHEEVTWKVLPGGVGSVESIGFNTARYTTPPTAVTEVTTTTIRACLTKSNTTCEDRELRLIPPVKIDSPGTWNAGQRNSVVITGTGFGTAPAVSLSDPLITFEITSVSNKSISLTADVPVSSGDQTFTVTVTSENEGIISSDSKPATVAGAVLDLNPKNPRISADQTVSFVGTCNARGNGQPCILPILVGWSATSGNIEPTSLSSALYTPDRSLTETTTVTISARWSPHPLHLRTTTVTVTPIPPPPPPPPVVTVGVKTSSSEVAENPQSPSTADNKAVVPVEVKISGGSNLTTTVTVDYRVDQRSALSGLDFRSVSGKLTFNAGSASGSTQTIEVPIIDDVSVESNEEFDVVLFNAVGASIASPTHTVTIRSNDVGPRRRACCGRAAPNPINPGGTVTLTPPETGAGYTYEWRTGSSYDSSDAPFSTSVSPTRQIFETTQFWVRTHTPEGETSDSDLIEVFVAPPSGVYVIAEPAGYVTPGNPVKLTASDLNGTRYEWRLGPQDPAYDVISEQSSVTVSPGLDKQYWVRVFYGSEYRDSEPFTVRVCNYPAVGAGTGAAGPYAAHNGTIDLFAHGSGLSYRWYAGEAGDTSSPRGIGSFLRPHITHDVEKFWVRGVDSCGQYDDSRTLNVYMCLPTITQQPQSGLLAPGQTATLTVAAIGGDGQPLPDSAYQWYRVGDPSQQPVATGASYTPPATTATATYQATVNVTCGGAPYFIRSGNATLEVCANPVIDAWIPGFITAAGQTATVEVHAQGTDLTYQWYQGTPPGGTLIPEATSSYLTVAPQNTTSYWCRVTSQGVCTSDSPAVPVTVCRTPVIDTPPASRRIFKNTSTTLSVAAHEVTDTPETYQWSQRSGSSSWTEIPDATSTSYTPPILSNETEYRVRVSAGLCSINSPTATISMCTYPEILTVFKDRNVSAGDTVTLTVNDISPVFDKNVKWFQGASGVRTTQLASGLNRTLIVAPTTTTQYWAEVEHQGCVSRTSTITVNVCVPKITADPVGKTVAAGTSTTLTVGAGGAPGLTYQWYKGQPGDVTQPIAGATSSSVTVSPTSTTSYWARVTGTCGNSVDSAAAVVTTCVPPGATTNAPLILIRQGQSATVSVNERGDNLTYQWFNGASGNPASPIAGATAADLTVYPPVTSTYWARVVSEGVCSSNGPTITVDVCSNPSVSAPQSKVIRTGEATTLSVTASSSTGPLTYQWYQGASGNTAAPISGATSSSYATPALTADTSYWVRVKRGACSTDSAAATVTVCKLTVSAGSNVNSASGQPVNVAVSVNNSRVAQPTVTWYAGSSGNISTPVRQGAGLVQITVAPTATTSYWARVNDGTCTADSNAMTVNVCKPTITTQPASVMINNGQSATLSAAASGAPLTYQWYAGDSGVTTSPIAGATGTSLTVAPTATTSYWVRASGCAGSTADSAAGTVEVCVPPTAPMPTASGPQAVGSFAFVSIAASGTDLTYQWYRGASGDTSLPLGGGTDSTYVFNAMSSAYYWVRVTGGCGAANSPAVLHNVNPQITTHPQNAAVISGSTVTLSVAASGSYLGYQWYQGPAGDVSNPIAGATSPTYTTPPLTANTSYRCKVTSGTSGVAVSNTAAITMCSGPTVTQFYRQYVYTNCYDLYITVGSAWQGKVIYTWYKGVPGNVAQSTYMQEAGTGGYRLGGQCVTEPTTYWVRVWTSDRSCYRDTGGLMISPVE